MNTTLVVDGYNAINAIPKVRKELAKSLECARKAILLLSKEYARSSGYITDVRVVFDGDDRYRHIDRMNIPGVTFQIFSRTGKGDDKVIETVRKYVDCGRVVLASNDNYIRNNARAYGAALVDVKELEGNKDKGKRIKDKAKGKKIDPSLEREITGYYMKALGLGCVGGGEKESKSQRVKGSKRGARKSHGKARSS